MKPYDLSGYHLTLPVDVSGNLSGKAAAIEGKGLSAGYQSPYFQQSNGVFTFLCPDGGAVTDTAHYARSELRNETEWSYKDKSTDIPLKVAVMQLGEGQKVVIDQIHDQKEPWLKLVYTHKASGGELRALVKIKDGASDTVISLLTGLKLGDVMDIKASYTPAKLSGLVSAKLTITVNGVKKSVTMKRTGKGGLAYWKRGNYYQCSDRKGAICIVVHS